MYMPSANSLDPMTSADQSSEASYDRVKAIVANRLRLHPAHLNDDISLERLGLDSVALAEILVTVAESYTVEIAAETVAARVTPVMTLRDLIDTFCTSVQPEQSDPP
jgi:acyl carrier protein